MSWLLAFLGFAALVILHELGHFTAAKAVGMRVERFALFFPPILGKIKRGETEYAIGSIPLGGYVKITGMNPQEELPPELVARSYAGSPVWKRIVVIAAGPLVNVVVAFLLLAGIYLSQGKPVAAVAVGPVASGLASDGILKEHDRILRVTAPAVAASAGTKALPARTAAGDQAGLTAQQYGARVTGLTNLISTGGCSPASLGTKSSDGRPQYAPCAAAQPLSVDVVRDGVRRTVAVTPKYDDKLKRYRLGISFGDGLDKVGVAGAASESVTRMWLVTRLTVESIVKIVYDPQARKEVSSVVGGYEATRQSFEFDTAQAISILALISLSLAIINLFPFLPLDGGHIFWAIIEKVRRGKPVATHVLEKASIVGFGLVMILFAIGLSNDVGHIVDGTGFGVR